MQISFGIIESDDVATVPLDVWCAENKLQISPVPLADEPNVQCLSKKCQLVIPVIDCSLQQPKTS